MNLSERIAIDWAWKVLCIFSFVIIFSWKFLMLIHFMSMVTDRSPMLMTDLQCWRLLTVGLICPMHALGSWIIVNQTDDNPFFPSYSGRSNIVAELVNALFADLYKNYCAANKDKPAPDETLFHHVLAEFLTSHSSRWLLPSLTLLQPMIYGSIKYGFHKLWILTDKSIIYGLHNLWSP